MGRNLLLQFGKSKAFGMHIWFHYCLCSSLQFLVHVFESRAHLAREPLAGVLCDGGMRAPLSPVCFALRRSLSCSVCELLLAKSAGIDYSINLDMKSFLSKQLPFLPPRAQGQTIKYPAHWKCTIGEDSRSVLGNLEACRSACRS